MKRKPIVAAVSAALGVTVLSSAACAGSTVESVAFIGMSAPTTVDEKSDAYTKAQVIYRYTNGKSKTYDLKYHQVTGTTELVNGKPNWGHYSYELLASNDQEAAERAWDIYCRQHPDKVAVLQESRVTKL